MEYETGEENGQEVVTLTLDKEDRESLAYDGYAEIETEGGKVRLERDNA